MVVVGEMGQVVSNFDFVDVLIVGQQGIVKGIEILVSLCVENGVDLNGEYCKGMEGIVVEVCKYVLDIKFVDEDVQDVVIIM